MQCGPQPLVIKAVVCHTLHAVWSTAFSNKGCGVSHSLCSVAHSWVTKGCGVSHSLCSVVHSWVTKGDTLHAVWPMEENLPVFVEEPGIVFRCWVLF